MIGEVESPPSAGWRRPTAASRHVALVLAVCTVALLFLRPLWLAMAPWLGRCRFRAFTGIPCPTCGTTRAAVALLEGRPLDAMAVNPLAAVSAFALLAFGLLGPLWVLAGGSIPLVGSVAVRRAMVLGLLLALANWVYLTCHG